jgi:hypothetical protein
MWVGRIISVKEEMSCPERAAKISSNSKRETVKIKGNEWLIRLYA